MQLFLHPEITQTAMALGRLFAIDATGAILICDRSIDPKGYAWYSMGNKHGITQLVKTGLGNLLGITKDGVVYIMDSSNTWEMVKNPNFRAI